jgi:hypothetical protein
VGSAWRRDITGHLHRASKSALHARLACEVEDAAQHQSATASPPRRRSPQAATSAPRNEQRSSLVSPRAHCWFAVATDCARQVWDLSAFHWQAVQTYICSVRQLAITCLSIFCCAITRVRRCCILTTCLLGCPAAECLLRFLHLHETLGQGARQILHRWHEVRAVPSLIFIATAHLVAVAAQVSCSAAASVMLLPERSLVCGVQQALEAPHVVSSCDYRT